MTGNTTNRMAHLWRLLAPGTLVMLVAFMSAACGGEGIEEAPAVEAPAPTDEASATREAEEPEPETAEEVAEAVVEPEAAEALVLPETALPETEVPDYAATPTVCEAHPENAPADSVSQRDLSRGVPDSPMAAAINATCEHDPADLAETFNQGGLRRHRQRDYVQSEHYFAQAVALDPSQLSARFNLACAMARQSAIDEAIEQLRELEKAGPEGVEYAGRAQRDRDFGEFHGTPILAALLRGIPDSVEAITSGRDVQLFSDEDLPPYQDARFGVVGQKVWEHGALAGDEFQSFVLTVEDERRRFRFFNDRPTETVQAALETMGMSVMLRHVGWTPFAEESYLVVLVSSRDEDRHTLYLASVSEEGILRLIAAPDLPPVTCDAGDEAVRTFVETENHRAFGYVTGCLSAGPATFERCLFYHNSNRGVVRRCGHGDAPAEDEAVTETAEATAEEAATAAP